LDFTLKKVPVPDLAATSAFNPSVLRCDFFQPETYDQKFTALAHSSDSSTQRNQRRAG